VDKVTVFFENAQITRSPDVQVKPGKTLLKFVNLSPYIQAYISVIDEEVIFLQENRKIGGKNQELSF